MYQILSIRNFCGHVRLGEGIREIQIRNIKVLENSQLMLKSYLSSAPFHTNAKLAPVNIHMKHYFLNLTGVL